MGEKRKQILRFAQNDNKLAWNNGAAEVGLDESGG